MRRLTLWHPESPGIHVRISAGVLRRVGLRRSEFATLGECIREDRRRQDAESFRRSFGVAA